MRGAYQLEITPAPYSHEQKSNPKIPRISPTQYLRNFNQSENDTAFYGRLAHQLWLVLDHISLFVNIAIGTI